MSESARRSIIVSFAASLLGLGLLICLLVVGVGPVGADTLLFVDDDNCPNVGAGTAVDPYCSIQGAVDAAPDFGEILVAAGTYTGTQTVTAKNGYVYTQVVIIDRKNITVTGGYDSNNWRADPDPEANPTIVDAQRAGRGFTVLGTRSQVVTLDGLTVTGGDYSGSGNPTGVSGWVCTGRSYDCGGGLRADKVRLILRHMVVFDNVAGRVGQTRSSQGGGMDTFELQPGSLIEHSKFISNTAGGTSGYGGGIYLMQSEVVIKDSLIEGNYAASSGGGLAIQLLSPVRLEGSSFKDNTAENNGGAIFTVQGYCKLKEEHLVMDGGYLAGNQALWGAAITIDHSSGSAADCGATLTNLILAGNRVIGSDTSQAVISVSNSKKVYPLVINHLTAAENEAPTFLYLLSRTNSEAFTATVNNTLVVSSSVGIAAAEDAGEMTLIVNNPLLDMVSDEFHTASGAPTWVVSNQVVGDSRLDATYHLQWGSAAIGAGIDAGVYHDIDGEQRYAARPDIGADEIDNLLFLPLLIG